MAENNNPKDLNQTDVKDEVEEKNLDKEIGNENIEEKNCDRKRSKKSQKDGCKDKKKSHGEHASNQVDQGESKPDDEENIKYLRLMADFQNYKRRVEKEKSDIYAFANEKLVGDMLDVIDNFDRALNNEGEDAEGYVEGMKMIYKQLMGVLEKAGLEEIEALGVDFDPNFHNAVMTEDTDTYESGKVSCVLQKGYMLNKKVIRPTMVKVVN